MSSHIDFDGHRNANEHDHNFGILLSPAAASNCSREERAMIAGVRKQGRREFDPCLAPGNFEDF
jgi:hypothetical protein